jgi:NADH-quinone oxidoreductase subunit A
MNVLEHYQVALIFLLVGAAMVAAPMLMLTLLRPSKPSVAKEIPYECGVDPIGDAHVCFDLRFYTDALIFVVFDVEAVLMFPWAKVFRTLRDPAGHSMTGVALVEGLLFVGVLALGLAYVWVKGDIDWVKSLAEQRGMVRAAGVPPELPHLGHADAEPPAEIETEAEAEAEEVVAAVADAISPTHHAAGHGDGHGHH